MEVVIIAGIVGLILLLAGFAVLFTKVLSQRDANFSPTDIVKEPFSPERYRAMERVLAKADENFLSSHPGCTRQMKKSFRKMRIAIFRGFVHLLSEDFNRICKAIKLRMITSDVDRSELAAVLIKQQFRFTMGMIYVECKLTLYSLGWKGIDASGLVQSLDAMRAQLQALSALAAPASC
ncbi:MAG: hypothetical protein LAP39_22030 [Acidobacteriia bacterium]|nr:hypothetical protein [Terriglobia bacterium]